MNNFKYKPEIDGLRAVAVIAVILNHISSVVLPGGYLGVDIFLLFLDMLSRCLFKKK